MRRTLISVTFTVIFDTYTVILVTLLPKICYTFVVLHLTASLIMSLAIAILSIIIRCFLRPNRLYSKVVNFVALAIRYLSNSFNYLVCKWNEGTITHTTSYMLFSYYPVSNRSMVDRTPNPAFTRAFNCLLMKAFSVFLHVVQVLGTGVSTARPANSGWIAAQFNSVDQSQQMVIQRVQPVAALCNGAITSRLKRIPVTNNDQRLVGLLTLWLYNTF